MSQSTHSDGLMSLHLVIPVIPPSVNHYKTFVTDRRGRGHYVVSKAFKGFKWAVAAINAGRQMRDSKAYRVSVVVFLGKNQRGDAANFEKGIGDGLQDAGVFRNDSRIKRYHIEVARDWQNPRTEILIEVYQPPAIPKLGEGANESGEVSLLSPNVRECTRPRESSTHRALRQEAIPGASRSGWREHARNQIKAL